MEHFGVAEPLATSLPFILHLCLLLNAARYRPACAQHNVFRRAVCFGVSATQ